MNEYVREIEGEAVHLVDAWWREITEVAKALRAHAGLDPVQIERAIEGARGTGEPASVVNPSGELREAPPEKSHQRPSDGWPAGFEPRAALLYGRDAPKGADTLYEPVGRTYKARVDGFFL